MRYTQVKDSLAAHKADLAKFWRRVRATRGKFWLLVVAGESECVPSDPTATSPVVVKALCRADDINPNQYYVRSGNQLTRAVNRPLVGVIATLLRKNHSEDDLDRFFGIETFWDICGTTRLFISDDSALAAGRLADLYIIAAGDSGEPIFSQVFSCKRRGEHSLVVTQSVEALFESAINERSSPVAVELRRRVDVLEGDALAEVESRLREQDAFKCEIEEILEEARVSGKHPSTILVGYHPWISIGGAQGLETDFVERETALRSFRDFEGLVRKAAREGFRLLDCRVIDRGDGRSPGALDAIADLVPAAERCLADNFLVFMPDGTAFPDTSKDFPNEIRKAAKRGRLFVASALDSLVETPDLLDDVLDQRLDRYRPFVPASEEHRNMLRTLGGAALPNGRNGSAVVFNVEAKKSDDTPRFRTVAAIQAELAEARAEQKAEPLVALTGYERSAPSTKMAVFDLEALLVDDPEGERSLKVDGARLLLAKWTKQVKLYDEDNSYTLKWGGELRDVTKKFKDIFRCGYNYKDAPRVNGRIPMLRGAPLMRYYIEVLEGEIKDATGDEEED